MTEPHDGAENTKRCAVCALKIPKLSNFCTHCENDQRLLMRFLRQAALVGAAIVAIIPLFQAASSLRALAEGKHAADVRLLEPICTLGKITVPAMNFGSGTAFLRVNGFSTTPANPTAITIRPAVNPIEPLAPSAYEAIQLTAWIGNASVDFPPREDKRSCKYQVKFQVEDANGVIPATVSCECPDL